MKAESAVLRVFKKMVVPSKVRYLESQFLPSAAGALFLGCFYNRNFGDSSFWFLWPTAQIFILIALAFIVFFAIRGVCAAVQTAHSGAWREHLLIWHMSEHFSLIWRPALLIAAVIFAEWLLFPFVPYNGLLTLTAIFCPVFLLGWVSSRMIAVHFSQEQLRQAMKGEAAPPSPLIPPEFGGLSQQISEITSAFSDAVSARIKSERFKADLITNVSHDLKNPLTSITSYVKLLQKQDNTPQQQREYLEILDKKSQQLKTLTENLIEYSKLSSGSEPVHLEKLNLSELVLQVSGAYEEELERRGLTLRRTMDSMEVFISMDGSKMMRILENLYQNACKYSLEGSRVYASLSMKGGYAQFSLMNISREPLNIPADELLERFTRGDAARSTEGNGLGLSIVKSLVELQGGSFEIEIRGDLFCTTVKMPLS